MTTGPATYPRRVVCLTEETVEAMYLLGQQDRIVGVSGRCASAGSALEAADCRLHHCQNCSDLQAEIARDLIGLGIAVMAFNQRSVPRIFDMLALLGCILGCEEKARS